MVTFNGDSKVIALTTDTTVDANLIYSEAKRWESLQDNMKYSSPMDAVGKADLGSGLYTDTIYKQTYGWKLQANGYVSNTQMKILGTLITDDNSIRTVPQASGSPVTWLFQVATAATIITKDTGSGLSTEEHNKLFAIPDETKKKIIPLL